jgi:GNAT superfamily N-acetyltransferase
MVMFVQKFCSFHNSMIVKKARDASTLLYSTKSKTASKIDIRFTENTDIPRVAEFITNSMYQENIPFMQKKKLVELERMDLLKTYGEMMGKRTFPASLLVAEIDQEIIGAVGVDCQIMNTNANKFRKIPAKGWSIIDMKETERIILVLANLSIRADKRGNGYAKTLMKEAEALAKELLFEDIYLLVDSMNIPAQSLYEKSGYKFVFKDEDATCVASGPLSLQNVDCVNFCYRKSLVAAAPIGGGGGFFGGLFSMFGKK